MTNDTAAGGHTATTNSTTDQPTLAVTQADIDRWISEASEPLGFFASVIKSGESWSQSCEDSRAKARHAIGQLGVLARMARTHSEPRPVAGLREALELLRDDDADPYSFSGDEDDEGRCITQHKFFRWGDDCVIAIGELNYQNQWDDKTFDAKVEDLQNCIATAPAPDPTSLEGGEGVWRTDMDAAKHGGHVVLNSYSPLWRYPFVGFWNAGEGWWEFSDPTMAACFAVSELVNQWSPLPAAHPSTQEG